MVNFILRCVFIFGNFKSCFLSPSELSIQIINSCQSGEITNAEIKAILNADKKTATFSLPCKISQIVNCNVSDIWISNIAGSQTNKVVNFILTSYIKDILLRSYVS